MEDNGFFTLSQDQDIANSLLCREYVTSSYRDEMIRGEGYRSSQYMEVSTAGTTPTPPMSPG